MSDLLPWPLLLLLLLLVLVLGCFCPLCLGQQRLSKSSSAAVDDDDDDDEGDGNLKQLCLGSGIATSFISCTSVASGQCRQREREREGERVPAGRVLISRLPNNTSQRRTLQQVDRHIPSTKIEENHEKLYPNNIAT